MRRRVVDRGWFGVGCELEVEGMAFRECWFSFRVNFRREIRNAMGSLE